MSFLRNRPTRISSTLSSHSSNVSTPKVQLRTIFKGRGSQREIVNQQNKQRPLISKNNSNISSNTQSRLSNSMKVDASSRLSCAASPQRSISRNTINKLDTLNYEEQLIYKLNPADQYAVIMNKLEQLDAQAEVLIQKKIHKIAKKSNSITLKDKGADQISKQIQLLIAKITNLKTEELQKINANQEDIKKFMDRKIKLLQKLLAETSTESEVLKKYFFAISAINHQNKTSIVKKQKKHIKSILQPLRAKPERSQTQVKESIYKESLSKQNYNPPRPQQYETYRYKTKAYIANTQPLPRSSYKCQFLLYSPKNPQANYKKLDNHTVFGKSRLKSSTYSQDYQNIKTEIINFKQLDSYKNKLKNIQVSYAAGNTDRSEEKEKYIQKSKRYIAEQLKMKYNSKNIKSIADKLNEIPKSSENRASINSIQSTQAKRSFKGYQQIYKSIVKNKDLENLKYSYRSLIND